MISYRTGNILDLDAVIDLYRASTLGQRRPIDDRARMELMLRNANLVISAWDQDLLVGISRSLSDFTYVTYLSDLAVRESHQRQGIGRELIRRTQDASAPATIILLAYSARGARRRTILPAYRIQSSSPSLEAAGRREVAWGGRQETFVNLVCGYTPIGLCDGMSDRLKSGYATFPVLRFGGLKNPSSLRRKY